MIPNRLEYILCIMINLEFTAFRHLMKPIPNLLLHIDSTPHCRYYRAIFTIKQAFFDIYCKFNLLYSVTNEAEEAFCSW